MRRVLFLVLLLIGLVSIGLSPLTAVDNLSAGLRVLDSDPLSGQELGLTDSISLYFDRPVDCQTAIRAFGITPTVEGDVTCDGTSVTFIPAGEYARATTYAVSFDNSIRGADDSTMFDDYALSLNTTGFLGVSEVFPSATSQVEADTVITVIFNRPVVPLVASTELDTLPHPLSIFPEVDGTGEWLNTSIYLFTPDSELVGGTTYSVSVNAGLEAVDGSILPEAYTWSFSTQPPEITFVNPEPSEGEVPLERRIQMTFNQPMDEASVEANFFLKLDIIGEADSLSGTFEWNEDSTGFSFEPDELLDISSFYFLGVDDGAVSKTGADLFGFNEWTFTTVPFPEITGTDPVDGSQGVSPYGGFSIYFATEMDVESLEGKITINPTPDREPNFYYNDWSSRYTVSFTPRASTIYNVTVAPGMMDVYGNVVEEGISFSYTTSAYSPSINLLTPGPIGFYSAYREPTQLFASHRNVSELNLNLYEVPVVSFVSQITDDEYYDITATYTPRDTQLIRDWTIRSTTSENSTRYDLLNLGEVANPDVTCPGAPASRVRVGDSAIVITDPDPLRARSAPVTGEVVDLLYRDYALQITDGPVCDNGVVWWEVELRDEVRAWIGEGIGDEYFIELQSRGTTTEVIVTPTDDQSGGRLTPGLYYLTLQSPETERLDWEPVRHFLMVSTAQLTVKATVDSVTIWATDAQTGKPVVGETITLYDSSLIPIGTAITNEKGIVRMETKRVPDLYSRRVAVLDSGDQFGIGFVGWTNGISPSYFGQNYSYYPTEFRAYLYTDRPVYRPDQPVYFRGIVRSKDDVSYSLPEFYTVPVEITDDRGEIIYKENVQLTEFGTFSGQVELSPDAPLGYYRISIDLPTQSGRRAGGSVSFTVAEYRLPEFQVDVSSVEPEVVQGDMVQVAVDSKYFFGGPVSNANITYNVVSDAFFFRYQGEERYDFLDYNPDTRSSYYGSSGGRIADGEAMTDDRGFFTIEVPADLEEAVQSQNFTVEAVVRDEGNQSVAGRSSVIVHQGLVYIGARPEQYVSTAGTAANVNLISVDWDSQPVAGQTIDVEVIERRWSSFQEKDDRGETYWTWELEEIDVTDGVVTTGADGKAQFNFTPPNGGVFKIIITSRDELGNEVRSSTGMWVSSREYVSWRQENDLSVELVPDKTEYTVGDTAKVLITSPYQGTSEALITVERGDVLNVEHVTMESNSYVYEFTIEADHAPNIFVNAFIVKGVDETNPIASFRMGITQMEVDISQKELHIDIEADREQASPQETVTYTLEATDYKGDPVVAEIGVAVTDLASLSLVGPNSGPMLPYFYSPQGLAVRTSTPLTINTDEITASLVEAKGGGGGIFDSGIVDIRGEFIDTPYWNGAVVTNVDGVATVDVRLPDNLTTWRLDARAVTSGADGLTLVGQDTFDLLSTRPLIVRPQTPRFFVVGDQVKLAAVVNNNTDRALSVNVSMRSEGVTLVDNNPTQEIVIEGNSRGLVVWNVVVDDVEFVTAEFIADAGAFADGSISPVSLDESGRLPVYRYEVPETIGTAGVLRDDDESRIEAILLPRRFEVTQGELTINLDQSLAATTIDGLKYLRNYPYQCIEQTVSRFLPNIMTFRALNELGLVDAEMEANLDHAVDFALQKLYAEQKSNGGWGWFIQDESNPITTAYALIGLVEAKRQGFPVSDEVIRRTQEFVTSSYLVVGRGSSTWQLNRQAFLLYAMSRSGVKDVSRAVVLFDHRAEMSLYAKGYLAQVFHMIDPDNTARTDMLVNEIVNAAVLSATGVHWQEGWRDYYNWNTNTRTTAILLSTLIKLRPDSELLPNVVRHLVTIRNARAWETTQETAWAVMALTDWMMASGELQPDYDYSVTLNDTQLTEGTATAATVRERDQLIVDVSDLLKDEANNIVFQRTGDDGALYYTAHLRAFLSVPDVEPLNRGIILDRRYTQIDDEAQTSVTQARIGDVVQVRLTIIAPNDLHYVVIEDPLPAGAEAINPNLDISQQVGTRPGLNRHNPLSRGWGWWWFSNIEFRDEKVVLYSTFLPAGTYEYVYTIRPGMEGTYNVIPPTGQEFYFPEVYGRGAGSTFTVLPFE